MVVASKINGNTNLDVISSVDTRLDFYYKR